MENEKEFLAMWRNLDGRVDSLKSIDFRCDHQANVDFVRSFPVDDVIANLFDFNRVVELYLEKRTGTSFFEQTIPLETVSLFNAHAYLKFYKDVHAVNDLNPGHPFIDPLDKKKKVFIFQLFSVTFSLANLFGNRDDMLVWYEKKPLILYFASCYLFFDYLFDDVAVPGDVKKKVVKYVRALFESKDAAHADDPMLTTIDNIFALLFKFEKGAHPVLYRTLLGVFNAEAESAKYQNFQGERPAEVDWEKIFFHTLVKSRETFNGLWNVLEMDVDYKADPRYALLMNHYGLIAQLVDDLNDVAADVAENNITIFSYASIYETGDAYFVEQAVKTVHYVFELRSTLKTIGLEELNEKNVEHMFALFLLGVNYAVSKHPVLTKALADYEHLFPFPFEFLDGLRTLKNATFLGT